MAPASPKFQTAQACCPSSDIGLDFARGREAVDCLSGVIKRIASQSRGGVTTRFDCVYPPDVSVHDYLTRLYDHMRCSPECYVLSLIYINRLLDLNSELALSVTNVHRLLLTTVVVAAKFFDDKYCANDYYAKIGGLATKELNSLEATFLGMVSWKVYVSQEECLECLGMLNCFAGTTISRNCEYQVSQATANVSSFVSTFDTHADMDVSGAAIDGRSTPKMTVQPGRVRKRSPVKAVRAVKRKKKCAVELRKEGQGALGQRSRCGLQRPIVRPKQRLRIIVVP